MALRESQGIGSPWRPEARSVRQSRARADARRAKECAKVDPPIQRFLVTLTAVENRLDKPNRPSLWGYLRRSNLRGDTAENKHGGFGSQGQNERGNELHRQCARSTPAKRPPRWRDSGARSTHTDRGRRGEEAVTRGWYSSPCRHKSQPRAGDSESVAQRPCRAGPGSSRPSSVTPHLLPSNAALDAPPEFDENMVAVAGTGGIRTSGAVDSGGCNLARSLCGRGVRTTRASVVLRRTAMPSTSPRSR